MYVVMNVVQVKEAEGFAGFVLLRRDRDGEYVVLSRWESEQAFRGWVDSDLFKMSHRHADGELAQGSEVRNYDVIDARVPA